MLRPFTGNRTDDWILPPSCFLRQSTMHKMGGHVVMVTTFFPTILPFQSIWKGKTVKSLPSTWHQFSHLNFQYGLNDQNHCSNLKTTQEYFHYHLRSCVNDDGYWVAFIDCWKIHNSKAFLAWIHENTQNAWSYLYLQAAQRSFSLLTLFFSIYTYIEAHLWREFNHFMSDVVKDYIKEGKDI